MHLPHACLADMVSIRLQAVNSRRARDTVQMSYKSFRGAMSDIMSFDPEYLPSDCTRNTCNINFSLEFSLDDASSWLGGIALRIIKEVAWIWAI